MQKNLRDISVSELTDLADINRGTFYLHYKDIYDLFEQTEKELLNNFLEILGKYRSSENLPLMPILLETFKYVEANSGIFIAVLRTQESTFLSRVLELCRPENQAEWNYLFAGIAPEVHEYYYSFIAFGCIAMLRRWFDNGMEESVVYMASLAEKMMKNCIEDKKLL